MFERASAACFKLLLRLFPAALRARYGGEMLEAFERQRAAVTRELGTFSALRYTLAAYIDLVRSALYERRPERTRPRERGSLSDIALDVRYALRAMRSAPAFHGVAIACLAVGIAVNAAAFSVLDALLMRDFPGVERQSELNTILISYDVNGGRANAAQLSTLDWDLLRDDMSVFSRSGVVGTSSVAPRLSGGAIAVRADFVSGGFFATLGTQPAAGRLLTAEDDRPGGPPVVLISHDLWTREFQQADVIGRPLQVGDVAFTIVGVAPEGFVGLYPGELTADPERGAPWLILPIAAAALVRPRSRYASDAEALGDRWLVLVGRRARGMTEADVEAQARVVSAMIAAAYPAERANASVVTRGPQAVSRAEIIAGFAFVMAVPLLIMLMVCANLANQLLARAVHRSREIAVRLSLGATRARLIRLLLVESTLLAATAGVAGLLLARVMTDALGAFALVLPFRIPMDTRVLLFTIVIAFVTALAFGLVPSLRATRLDLAQSIKEGAGTGGRNRARLRNAFVVTQVGASVALLTLSGVFARGSQRSRISEDAANHDRVLSVGVDLDLLGYEAPAGLAFQRRAMERLRSAPGVEAVALSTVTPSGAIGAERVRLPGDAEDRVRYYEVAAVSGDWFTVRNIRPLAGRLLTDAETRGGASVVVVDEAAARRIWGDANALGRTLRIGEGDGAVTSTVIGVMPTVRDRHGHNDDGVITMPAGDEYHARSYFYVRTRGNAADLRVAVRDILRELDPRLPPAAVATLGESLDELGAPVAQMAAGVGTMGTIALLLAALGLSAVLSFIVEQRRHEIGVRVALGARSVAVTWLVMRQSLQLTVIGIVIGGVLAALTATLMRGILFGLPPIDPVAFAGSTAVILLAALLSSAAPARRAARVDPLIALKAS